MMKVAKFGGSSLSSTAQLRKVQEIVQSDSARKVVVVSAPGKDDTNSSKVTDLLLLLYAHIEYGIDYTHLLTTIYNRYKSVVDDLHLSNRFEEEFMSFKQELNKGIQKDYLVSRGEYFSAIVVSELLGFEFVDAKDIITVGFDGNINYDKTTSLIQNRLDEGKQYVVPGFYASSPEGHIRTFSRGGSDLTGSILAKALNVDLYENWTDVSGLYVANPTIVENPKRIANITYNELRELSYRGANIIQQESLIPLEKTGIAIHIKNTNQPEDHGTIISRDIEKDGKMITGISGQPDFTSLTIVKDSSKAFSYVLKEVLEVFLKYKLNIEHIPTGIDTFSVITKTSEFKNVYFDMLNDLRKVDGIVDITSEDKIALIAIVGRNMSHIPGVSGKLFSTLGKKQINIRVIAQASKEISIIIGVDEVDYQEAVNVLYEEFYVKNGM